MTTTFPLGRTVITPNAMNTLRSDDVQRGLARHASGDWGDLCPEDRETNDNALKADGRLFSAYRGSCGTKFWIITEADRSATTVLLPEDY